MKRSQTRSTQKTEIRITKGWKNKRDGLIYNIHWYSDGSRWYEQAGRIPKEDRQSKPAISSNRVEIEEGEALDNVFRRSDESHLEEFIAIDPSVIEDGLRLVQRQRRTLTGKIIDLECEDSEGRPVVVELKKGETPDKVVAQLLSYMEELSREHGKQARGILVCERENARVSSAFRQIPEKVKVLYWY
jgi:hypothetical protein